MTNSKILFDNLVQNLKLNEPEDETHAIAFEVLGHFGISKTDILAHKRTDFSFQRLLPLIERLNKNEPVQYVLGEAWFCGHKFLVTPSVLIPRPETEMLVEEAIKDSSKKEASLSILDVGTGSGCIAISLALMFPHARVWAIDVSDDALTVARQNAQQMQTSIQFLNHDILQGPLKDQMFDLIVSNPPYISEEEKPSISKNVIDYEPHLALFAHATDPLIFYKALSKVAVKNINPGGRLLVEINERLGQEIQTIFLEAGLSSITISRDLAGKDRVVSACVP